jgi:ABC-type oligopeptide transport system ATPase subunit
VNGEPRVDRTNNYIEVTVTGVSKNYGSRRAGHVAVDDVTAVFSSERTVGVVGESGSGKSTLAKMLVGFERPSSGTIALNGEPIGHVLESRSGRADFRRAVQFIGQDTTSSFDPRQLLEDSILLPLQRLLGLDLRHAHARMGEVLDQLGLARALAQRYPLDVSGGQRQRFAIARGLAVRPRLLICDEVVSALDVSVQGAVLNLLKDYCEEAGAGLVFVSHGLPATGFVTRDLLVMYRGTVVEDGATADIFRSPQHPYTQKLLDAYRGKPSLDRAEELVSLPV